MEALAKAIAAAEEAAKAPCTENVAPMSSTELLVKTGSYISSNNDGSTLLDGSELTYWQSSSYGVEEMRSVSLLSATPGAKLGSMEIYLKQFGCQYEPREVDLYYALTTKEPYEWVAVRQGVQLPVSGGWTTLLTEADVSRAEGYKMVVRCRDKILECKVAAMRVYALSSAKSALHDLEEAVRAASAQSVDPVSVSRAGDAIKSLQLAIYKAPLRAAIAAADALAGLPNVSIKSDSRDAHNIIDGDEDTYCEFSGECSFIEVISPTSKPLGKLEICYKPFKNCTMFVAISKKTGPDGRWSNVKFLSLPACGGWRQLLSESVAGMADRFLLKFRSTSGKCRIVSLRVGDNSGEQSYTVVVAQLERAIENANLAIADCSLMRETREKLVSMKRAVLERPLRAAVASATAALADPVVAATPFISCVPDIVCKSHERGHPGSHMFDENPGGTYWQSNGSRVVILQSPQPGIRLGELEIYLTEFGSDYEPRTVHISRMVLGEWHRMAQVPLRNTGGWFQLMSAADVGDADQLMIEVKDCGRGVDCKIGGLRLGGRDGVAPTFGAVVPELDAAINLSLDSAGVAPALLKEAESTLARVRKAAAEWPLRVAMSAADAALAQKSPPVARRLPRVTTGSRRSDAHKMTDGDCNSYWESNGERSVEIASSTPGAPLGRLEILCRRFGCSYEPREVKLYKMTLYKIMGSSSSAEAWSHVKTVPLPESGGWKVLLSESEAGLADRFRVDVTDCRGGINCRIAGIRVSGNYFSGASSLTIALKGLVEAIEASSTSAELPESLLNEAKRYVSRLKKERVTRALESAVAGTFKEDLEAALAMAQEVCFRGPVIRKAQERLKQLVATRRAHDEVIGAIEAAETADALLECFAVSVSIAAEGTFDDHELDEHRQRLGKLLATNLSDADPDLPSGSLDAFRKAADQATAAQPYLGTTSASLNQDLALARKKLANLDLAEAKRQQRILAGCPNDGMLPDMPTEFHCPISREPMTNPVVAADGFTYERSCIERWLLSDKTSPKTNEQMGTTILPNTTLKILIDDWADKEHEKFMANSANRQAPALKRAPPPSSAKVAKRRARP